MRIDTDHLIATGWIIEDEHNGVTRYTDGHGVWVAVRGEHIIASGFRTDNDDERNAYAAQREADLDATE